MGIMSFPAAVLLMLGSAAYAASADYFLTIDGVSADPAGGALYLRVQAADLDGDGAADQGVVKLACTGATIESAHYAITSPRDSASGQASGKRMHKPMTIVKEWGPATPQLAAIKPSYDVKKVEGSGARLAGGEPEWTPVVLSNADGLCAEASRAVKTRSNIQNN